MKKSKAELILFIINIIIVVIATGLLIGNILLSVIPYRMAYGYRSKSLMDYSTALSVLVVVFSGLSLLSSPFTFLLKKKVINIFHIAFTFAAGGVALGLGISESGRFLDSQEIIVLVFGGILIFFGVILTGILVATSILSLERKSSKKNNCALKSLEALKKEGLLSEEEYNEKLQVIKEKEKEEVKADPDICPECGKRRHKGDKFCASCGYKYAEEVLSTELREPMSALTKTAQVFFYIGFGITCATVIGLCWALPMLHIYKRDRDTIGKHSIAFKVCTLLFISEIAGVLMLIDYKH